MAKTSAIYEQKFDLAPLFCEGMGLTRERAPEKGRGADVVLPGCHIVTQAQRRRIRSGALTGGIFARQTLKKKLTTEGRSA